MMPLGILNAPATVAVTRNTSVHVKQEDAAKMAGALVPLCWNHAIWACSVTVVEDLFKITGFVPNEDPLGTEQGCIGSLYTRPVFVSEKMPKLGQRGDLLLFDPSMYVVGNRQEVEISISTTGPGFNTNETRLKVWIRCDGRCLMDSAVTLTDPNGQTQTNVSSVVLLAA